LAKRDVEIANDIDLHRHADKGNPNYTVESYKKKKVTINYNTNSFHSKMKEEHGKSVSIPLPNENFSSILPIRK